MRHSVLRFPLTHTQKHGTISSNEFNKTLRTFLNTSNTPAYTVHVRLWLVFVSFPLAVMILYAVTVHKSHRKSYPLLFLQVSEWPWQTHLIGGHRINTLIPTRSLEMSPLDQPAHAALVWTRLWHTVSDSFTHIYFPLASIITWEWAKKQDTQLEGFFIPYIKMSHLLWNVQFLSSFYYSRQQQHIFVQ